VKASTVTELEVTRGDTIRKARRTETYSVKAKKSFNNESNTVKSGEWVHYHYGTEFKRITRTMRLYSTVKGRSTWLEVTIRRRFTPYEGADALFASNGCI